MSGLSSANAASGFMQGFNFMENQQDRQIQRDRQAKADARADEEYEYTLTERDRIAERRGTLEAREDTQWNQQQGEYKEKLAERFNTKLDALALALEEDPDYDWQSDPRFSEFAKAGPTMEGLMSGQVPLESPEVGALVASMAPDLIEQSEAAADLDGTIYLTRGKQPGTLMIGVRKKDGTIVPKTERQSTAEDDPVRQYPVDGFMQRGMAYAKAPEYLKDPQARRAWLQSRGKLPKPTTDKNAGEYERLLAMRAQYKPGSEEYKALSARMRKLTHIDGDNKPHTLTLKDDMGAEYAVEKVGGSWRFVDPGMAPAKMREEAASFAQDQIDDMAGTFRSDEKDFKQFGGNRDRAYDYFYNQKLNDLATQNAKRQEMTADAMNGGLESAEPTSAPQAPESGEQPERAPAQGNQAWASIGADKQKEALARLEKDPSLAPWFEKTFGYLPQGGQQTADSMQADAAAGLPEVPRPGGLGSAASEEPVNLPAGQTAPEPQYDPSRIQDPEIRAKVEQALQNGGTIEDIRAIRNGGEDWVNQMTVQPEGSLQGMPATPEEQQAVLDQANTTVDSLKSQLQQATQYSYQNSRRANRGNGRQADTRANEAGKAEASRLRRLIAQVEDLQNKLDPNYGGFSDSEQGRKLREQHLASRPKYLAQMQQLLAQINEQSPALAGLE